MSASLTLFEKEHAAREKYSYFICGVAGALFAFISKDYVPIRPFGFQDKIMFAAMISLTVSFGFGLAQMLCCIKGTSLNKDVLGAGEEITNLYDALTLRETGGANFTRNLITGKEYANIAEIKIEAETLKQKRAVEIIRMKKWFNWSTGLFVTCHVFLVLGFFFLIYAKFAP